MKSSVLFHILLIALASLWAVPSYSATRKKPPGKANLTAVVKAMTAEVDEAIAVVDDPATTVALEDQLDDLKEAADALETAETPVEVIDAVNNATDTLTDIATTADTLADKADDGSKVETALDAVKDVASDLADQLGDVVVDLGQAARNYLQLPAAIQRIDSTIATTKQAIDAEIERLKAAVNEGEAQRSGLEVEFTGAESALKSSVNDADRYRAFDVNGTSILLVVYRKEGNELVTVPLKPLN